MIYHAQTIYHIDTSIYSGRPSTSGHCCNYVARGKPSPLGVKGVHLSWGGGLHRVVPIFKLPTVPVNMNVMGLDNNIYDSCEILCGWVIPCMHR